MNFIGWEELSHCITQHEVCNHFFMVVPRHEVWNYASEGLEPSLR
jgi:hypothetical protein